MTTSVLERTREIGVLQAIGARARDVPKVFLAEGTSIAVFG
jgi:ABC-type lipoprotein release transport system permease subunit